MKYWFALLAIAGLASGCQGCCGGQCCCEGTRGENPVARSTPAPNEPTRLTMFFDGLVTYVQDGDGDGVTVLLVDSRTESPKIPAHVPLMTLDSSSGSARSEVPLVFDREDIEIVLDPPPATKHLDADPHVWDWTGSLSRLTGGVIKPEILDMTKTPKEVVARIRLEHGRLEVDPRDGAVLDSPVTFETADGTAHPSGYGTTKVALLIKYTVEVGNKITIKRHPMGKMNDNDPTRTIDVSAQGLRVSISNIAAKKHGDSGTDHHFARLYDLVSPTPLSLFLPHFVVPVGLGEPGGPDDPTGVGSRACMGGGG